MAYTPLGKALYRWDSENAMADISSIPGMQIGDRVMNNTETSVVLLGTITRPGEVVEALSQYVGQVVGLVPEKQNKVIAIDVGQSGVGNVILYDSYTKCLTVGIWLMNVSNGDSLGVIPAKAPIPTTDRIIAGFGITTTNTPVIGFLRVETGGNLIVHLNDTSAKAQYLAFEGVTYLG